MSSLNVLGMQAQEAVRAQNSCSNQISIDNNSTSAESSQVYSREASQNRGTQCYIFNGNIGNLCIAQSSGSIRQVENVNESQISNQAEHEVAEILLNMPGRERQNENPFENSQNAEMFSKNIISASEHFAKTQELTNRRQLYYGQANASTSYSQLENRNNNFEQHAGSNIMNSNLNPLLQQSEEIFPNFTNQERKRQTLFSQSNNSAIKRKKLEHPFSNESLIRK